MKKILFRVLSIILVLCTMLSAVACDRGQDENNEPITNNTYNYDSGIDKSAKPFNLTNNGTSEYTIVFPENASSVVINVANELASYVSQSSGASLPVVSDKTSVSNKFISLGDTKNLASLNLNGNDVKDDGYIVKTVGENVYIYGSEDLGVQNGTYCFIERFLGVRWVSEIETYLPKTQTIQVYPCEIKEEPIFTFREWYSSAPRFSEDYYKHKMFNNGKAVLYTPVDSDHNITDYVNRQGIGWVNKFDVVDADGNWLPGASKNSNNYYLVDIHPEYFTDEAGIDVEGNLKPAKPSASYDICYTCGINADGSLREGDSTARYVIEKAKRALAEDAVERKYKKIHIGQMDVRGALCQCNICKSRLEEIRYSGMIVMFINAIEKEVNEWLQQEQNRTVVFTTFAYHESENPPVKLNDKGEYEPITPACEVSDNVWIKIAPIDADYSYGFTDERQTEFYQNIFGGWKAISENLMIWDYNVCFFDNYFFYPNRAYMKSNLEFYESLGVRQIFQEAGADNQRERWQNLLSMYIASKLYWNLDWDVNELEEEFISLYYCEGYDAAKTVIKNFENYFEVLRCERPLEIKVASGATIYLKPDMYKLGFLNKQIDILDEGINELIQTEGLDVSRKTELMLRLKELKLTPMTMIYKNYESYYHANGYEDFAKKYLEIIDEFGLTSLGYTNVADLRAKHGLV